MLREGDTRRGCCPQSGGPWEDRSRLAGSHEPGRAQPGPLGRGYRVRGSSRFFPSEEGLVTVRSPQRFVSHGHNALAAVPGHSQACPVSVCP